MSNDTVQEETTQNVGPQAAEGYATRTQREELKALSTEVFGASSRYQKLYVQKELITRKTEEIVPGENGQPDTTKMVEVPILFNGVKQYKMKYRNTEEVLQLLREFKVKRETILAEMKKQQDEAKAKKEAEELATKVQEDLSGTALT